MPQAIQDTIEFTLAAERTVVNDTVKIVATISGMVTTSLSEQNLRTSIRDLMNRFIKADWQFARLTRNAHASGLEEINLTASARVPESENRALDSRRREASRAGEALQISSVVSDVSFHQPLVDQAERELRIEIIKKSREECEALSAAAERSYRVARIVFERVGDLGYSNNRQMVSASAASVKTQYGTGFGADDVIGNAQKLTMTAQVTLAVWVPADAPEASA